MLSFLLCMQLAWTCGDTHVHAQLCDSTDLTLAQVQAEAAAADLDFCALQLWSRYGDKPEFFALAPLVTGSEAAPGIQYGVEVSGFAASQFGHLQVLDCDDATFPYDALWSGPIWSHYDEAVRGYAHVVWLESDAPIPFIPGQGAAYMAPIDAALRRIDFIETLKVDSSGPGMSWRGMAYRLWGAGLRTGIAAGSDNTCVPLNQIGDGRTWSHATSYAGMCQAIRAGAVSVADGTGVRVEIEVNGQLTARRVGPAGVGTLEIIVNGAAVAGLPYVSQGEEVVLVAPMPPSSSWVAAKCAGAHTAPVYLPVASQPILVAQDCAYWKDYCDGFAAALPTYGVKPVQAEMLAAIGKARAIYAASYARTQPWPAGVSEYGASTPGCYGPISAGVAGPLLLDCLSAPSNAPGWLIVGVSPGSVVVSGITLLVDPTKPYALLPVTANEGGYAQKALALPAGKTAYAQFIWASSCGGALCSSNGLTVASP